jgi:hypothetical protein
MFGMRSILGERDFPTEGANDWEMTAANKGN